MKKIVLFAGTIMFIALFCMAINLFIVPLPDMVVRIIGIVMIGDLVVLTYSSIKLNTMRANRKKGESI